MTERQELENAIATLESKRAALGDFVVDAVLAPMRARLAELRARPAGEQRKLVTILFADLLGFTAMAEQRDPEDDVTLLSLEPHPPGKVVPHQASSSPTGWA